MPKSEFYCYFYLHEKIASVVNEFNIKFHKDKFVAKKSFCVVNIVPCIKLYLNKINVLNYMQNTFNKGQHNCSYIRYSVSFATWCFVGFVNHP